MIPKQKEYCIAGSTIITAIVQCFLYNQRVFAILLELRFNNFISIVYVNQWYFCKYPDVERNITLRKLLEQPYKQVHEADFLNSQQLFRLQVFSPEDRSSLINDAFSLAR